MRTLIVDRTRMGQLTRAGLNGLGADLSIVIVA
jgi:hypothetical protein